ncbi:MAG: FmdB family zinc ribbon protein [Anaerolineae bacterium]
MPKYDYRCKKCGIVFERYQRFSEEPITCCPECDGTVYRLISPVGIVFKGSGFYITDHRNNSTAMLPGTKKTEGESATETKTDTPAPVTAATSTPAPVVSEKKPDPPRP